MKTIQEKLKELPQSPGIYLMKDRHGDIIYVGKAKNLKNRVRSYFHHNPQHSKKVQRLVWNIADLSWEVVATELDALLLECRLIQIHQPIYNRMMKTHTNYQYVAVTTEEVTMVASPEALLEGTLYGPFRQYKQLPELLELLQETYLLAGNSEWLTLAITRQLPEMAQRPLPQRLAAIKAFFAGEPTDFIQLLDRRIAFLAENLHFEKAAELQQQRERVQHFQRYVQKRTAFYKQEHLVYELPLADGQYKKVYQISHGRLLATVTVPLTDTVNLAWPPSQAGRPLAKEEVDPMDILLGFITGHPSGQALV